MARCLTMAGYCGTGRHTAAEHTDNAARRPVEKAWTSFLPIPGNVKGWKMTDDELVTFASEFREGILDGDVPALMCFAVCAPLVTLLGLYGVDADMVERDLGWVNHFWLRLHDGRVLDPTADQFNDCEGYERLPPVYLGPPRTAHSGIAPRIDFEAWLVKQRARKLSPNPRTHTDA